EIYDHPANQFVAGFIGNPPMNFLPVTVERVNGSLMLKNASVEFRVPDSLNAEVSSFAGREVVMGIRPEDIYDRLFYNYEVKKSSTFKAKIDVVEPMGAEIYLYFHAGPQDLIARLPPYVKAKISQEMEFVFN